MLTRRESRMVALQTLFYLDFNRMDNIDEAYEYSLNDLFDSLKEDDKKVKNVDDDSYSYFLVKNILEKKDILDDKIREKAPEWPLEKISLINKSILRIGIFELLFNNEIPNPVAVNEAIELSKKFNPVDSSTKFISAVMGSIFNKDKK